MANFNRDVVTMNVDRQFFDNLFEPSRIKTQKQLGLDKLGQKDFTKLMFQSGFKLDIKLKDKSKIGGIDGIKKPGRRKRKKS